MSAWAILLLSAVQTPARAQTETPLLLRIKMATVAAPDLRKMREWYTKWLGYKVRESGTVSKDLAASWGAPKTSGHPYVLMSSESSPDVFIRGVEIPAVPGYRPMTTWGWNAFEIIVNDIDAAYAKIQKSPFTVIGLPRPLMGNATTYAMQVKRPGNEVLYLTMQNHDAPHQLQPGGPVGRPFILVVGGPDLPKLRDAYADAFHMTKTEIRDAAVMVLRAAQNLPDGMFGLTSLRLREQRNAIELDQYTPTTTARPRAPGQLPPGNAIATFTVASLDGLAVNFIAPPRPLYGKHRAATFIGPAGELTELIEYPGS